MTTARARKTAEPTPTGSPEPTRSHTGDPDLDATWAALMAPFPEDWVEKLPKPLKGRDENRGRCDSNAYSADGHFCGGWHARAVHLDYVGHAGITMRLNDTVGPAGWNLEPMSVDSDGLPIISGKEFWVRLTILGVSKIELAANFQSPQEALGDGLRRAAMRFGVGTYLWSKSDHALNMAVAQDDRPEPSVAQATAATSPETHAPNGQSWRLPDGSPNPDALEPHQRHVWDGIGHLSTDESTEYHAWHAAEGLPQVRFLDTFQAEAAVSKLREMVAARPPA